MSDDKLKRVADEIIAVSQKVTDHTLPDRRHYAHRWDNMTNAEIVADVRQILLDAMDVVEQSDEENPIGAALEALNGEQRKLAQEQRWLPVGESNDIDTLAVHQGTRGGFMLADRRAVRPLGIAGEFRSRWRATLTMSVESTREPLTAISAVAVVAAAIATTGVNVIVERMDEGGSSEGPEMQNVRLKIDPAPEALA